MDQVIVGKRISVGGALTSLALVLGEFWPDYLKIFVAAAIPITFVVQVLIVNTMGVTTKKVDDAPTEYIE